MSETPIAYLTDPYLKDLMGFTTVTIVESTVMGMPGRVRRSREVELGSPRSLFDDLRTVRSHGSVASADHACLAGLVALVGNESASIEDLRELVRSAVRGGLAAMRKQHALDPRWIRAIDVLAPIFSSSSILPYGALSERRSELATTQFCSEDQIRKYEDKVLEIASAAVYRQAATPPLLDDHIRSLNKLTYRCLLLHRWLTDDIDAISPWITRTDVNDDPFNIDLAHDLYVTIYTFGTIISDVDRILTSVAHQPEQWKALDATGISEAMSFFLYTYTRYLTDDTITYLRRIGSTGQIGPEAFHPDRDSLIHVLRWYELLTAPGRGHSTFRDDLFRPLDHLAYAIEQHTAGLVSRQDLQSNWAEHYFLGEEDYLRDLLNEWEID